MDTNVSFAIDVRGGFFHAMLSYRVNTDSDLVTKIHDKLHLLAPNAGKSVSQVNPLLDSSPFPDGFRRDESTLNSSLLVFQDVHCLKDGMGWEGDGGVKSGGFVGALRLSAVFVPIFSAINVDQSGEVVHRGSVGQLINLAREDMQDNVLLELIIARELYLLSKRNSKTIGKKALAPCSYIFPLFRHADIWQAVPLLPNTASVITNAKALCVMKQMEVPDEAISHELRNGTLTVHAVWEFFAQFQGIKLYDRGEERFQVLAAANAIIGVIDEVRGIVAELKFHDLKMNSSQMYELSQFMSQLNMSNYTAILASHHIRNVFQLAQLKQSRADALVQSIAEYGVRASDKSTLPIELSKLGIAIDAANQSSELAKPLNERFRHFIDRDAAFVTMLSSSSLFDIGLSQKPAVLLLFIFSSIYAGIWGAGLVREQLQNPEEFIQGYLIRKIQSLNIIPYLMIMFACLIAVHFSPRLGRYFLAFAFLFWSILEAVSFAVAAYSAMYDNCGNCVILIPSEALSSLSNLQKSLTQPTGFVIYLGLVFAISFKQQYTFPILFICQFFNNLVKHSILGWPFALKYIPSHFTVYNAVGWLCLFFVMRVLRYIGNKRAVSIYNLNADLIEDAYTKLCERERQIGSLFGNLCTFHSLEPRPSQFPCFGIFCKQPNSEQASRLAPCTTDRPVVCVSDPDHHLIAKSSEFQEEAKRCREFQKIVSIQEMFKTERMLRGDVLQHQCSLTELIQDAEFINDAFQEWVSSWLSDGPDLDTVQNNLYLATEQIDQCFLNLCSKLTNSAYCNDSIKGMRIRGPLKHVDRAIAKVSALLCSFNIALWIKFLDFCS
jgi:hypothetical protein